MSFYSGQWTEWIELWRIEKQWCGWGSCESRIVAWLGLKAGQSVKWAHNNPQVKVGSADERDLEEEPYLPFSPLLLIITTTGLVYPGQRVINFSLFCPCFHLLYYYLAKAHHVPLSHHREAPATRCGLFIQSTTLRNRPRSEDTATQTAYNQQRAYVLVEIWVRTFNNCNAI